MSLEEENDGFHVTGNIAVEGGEDLQEVEEDIDTHGVDNDRGQCLDGIASRIKARQSAHDEEQKQENGRT